MPSPQRGEVWIVDLGYAAKRRPCLVLSIPPETADRALVTTISCTTARRKSRFEVELSVNFLQPGSVFDAQGINTVPQSKLERRLGELTQEQLTEVENAVKRWLGLIPLESDDPTSRGYRQERHLDLG